MKKIMELLQNMKAKNEKKDNKGFSLVELIIVIAIMAILVGIVGTQVLPYINKSKEAKDLQIINSYCTAAATAYSTYAEKITTTDSFDVDVYAAGLADDDTNKKPLKTLQDEIQTLTGYKQLSDLTNKMGSKKGKQITKVVIQINPTTKDATSGLKAKAGTIVTQAYYKGDGEAAKEEALFDPVVTQL